MTDERAALRADLEAGRWWRLTEPLVMLVLLDDPSWWPVAREKCLGNLIADYWVAPPGSRGAAYVHTFDQTEGHRARPASLTEVARSVVARSGERRPDVLAAIEVCERWSVP